MVVDPKFPQDSSFTRSTPLGVTSAHFPLIGTGAGSAAAVTDGKLVRTLNATAKVPTILCIVNPTTKMVRGQDGWRRTPIASCSTGALRNFKTVANCSLGMGISDEIQPALCPKDGTHDFLLA